MDRFVFGDPDSIDLARRARRFPPDMQMRICFGSKSGHLCGECRNFEVISPTEAQARCNIYEQTHEGYQRWQYRMFACGKFEPKGKEKP